MDDADPDMDGDDDMDGDEDMDDMDGDDDVSCGSKKSLKKIGSDDMGDEMGGGLDMKMSKKKSKKNMKEGQDPWWDSLKSQLSGGSANQKFGDGWSEYQTNEEKLLAPSDPNASVEDQAGPGEVGYAPQQRVGDGNSSWFA